jgi:PEP-CTERM motif
MSKPFHRKAASTVCAWALGLAGVLGVGQAGAVAVSSYTYNFTADCIDCGQQVSGSLQLFNYTVGSQIGATNFGSFKYNGSVLMNAFMVGGVPDDGYAQYSLLPPAVTGIINADEIPTYTFQATGGGNFFACAPGAALDAQREIKQACDGTNVAGPKDTDFGNQFVFTNLPQPPVDLPEPGSLALMGLALAGLAVAARRRKPI